MKEGNLKKKLELPEYYTNIEPVDKKTARVPPLEGHQLIGDATKVKEYRKRGEEEWMKKVNDVICNNDIIDKNSNITWAAFHAAREIQIKKEVVSYRVIKSK